MIEFLKTTSLLASRVGVFEEDIMGKVRSGFIPSGIGPHCKIVDADFFNSEYRVDEILGTAYKDGAAFKILLRGRRLVRLECLGLCATGISDVAPGEDVDLS